MEVEIGMVMMLGGYVQNSRQTHVEDVQPVVLVEAGSTCCRSPIDADSSRVVGSKFWNNLVS